MCVSVVVFGFLVLNICICICISCGFKPSLKILFELIPLNLFELIPVNSFGTYITAWQLKPVSATWTVPCLFVLLSSWIHCRFAKLNPFVSTLHCGHDVGHFVVETFQCDFVRNEASEIHWYKQTRGTCATHVLVVLLYWWYSWFSFIRGPLGICLVQ